MNADMTPPSLVADTTPSITAAAMTSSQVTDNGNLLARSSMRSPVIKVPQPTNDSQSIISLDKGAEHGNSLANNLMKSSNFNSPLQVNELQPQIFSTQGTKQVNSLEKGITTTPTLNSPPQTNQGSQVTKRSKQVNRGRSKKRKQVTPLANNLIADEDVYIPIKDEEEFKYPDQNLNQEQQQQFVEEMIELSEKTDFPWLDNKSQF